MLSHHIKIVHIKNRKEAWCMCVGGYAFNPITQEAEEGGTLWVWGKSSLHSVFQDNQDYIETVSKTKIL